ncbi:MAG TPA: hypothetical protein VFT75_12480 [Nocardioidaceae bacterium]|jgi:hypothetical protein|nr:hypothetical protein [Nocardioidaceae bacterium]
MADEAKRSAQEALYSAIQSQAETNMKAAMSAAEKAALLRDLAEAYRLAAGGSMPDGTGRREKRSSATGPSKKASKSPAGQRRRVS